MERTERIIKSYYKDKRRLNILFMKLETQERRIERVTRDIKNCNVTIEVPGISIDYSEERVQGGQTTSSIELALERSIDILIKELERAIDYRIRLETRIRNLEEKIMNIEIFLEELEEEERKLLELIYDKNMRYRFIEHEMGMAIGTITNTKKRILIKIKDMMNKS